MSLPIISERLSSLYSGNIISDATSRAVRRPGLSLPCVESDIVSGFLMGGRLAFRRQED